MTYLIAGITQEIFCYVGLKKLQVTILVLKKYQKYIQSSTNYSPNENNDRMKIRQKLVHTLPKYT